MRHSLEGYFENVTFMQLAFAERFVRAGSWDHTIDRRCGSNSVTVAGKKTTAVGDPFGSR